MRKKSISKLGEVLFENIEIAELLWTRLLGTHLSNTWESPDKSLEDIIISAQAHLNRNESRRGHCSLLLKDPISDRLTLEYSTNKELNPGYGPPPKHFLTQREANYDSISQHCYYSLSDRLANEKEKNSPEARKTRGLTGWVAVTGHPLRVNSERSKSRLEDIPKDNPETYEVCNIYGTPVWGNHIAEFARENIPNWTKRFLAVPIISLTTNTSIGVLRYTCLQQDSVLTELDLQFLESMAQLVSVIKNLEWVKIRNIREYKFNYAVLALKQTGDLNSYLKFIADSLDSEIASLYIYLDFAKVHLLRLMDAYGISGFVEDLRDKMHDYSDQTRGLTWELFKKEESSPIVYQTVLQTQNWRGLNTSIFYEKALSRVGISQLDCHLRDQLKCKELLTSYKIKLVGRKLQMNNIPIGVLKVEFPCSFDFGKHYDSEDKNFFERCANVLVVELNGYRNFLNCNWFNGADERKSFEFAKMINQIIKLQIIEDDETTKQFWSNVKKYSEKYHVEIAKANDLIAKNLTEKKSIIMFKKIWKRIPDWMKQTAFTETFKKLLDSMPV